MDYNSNRNKLVLKEYGRHVQKIVEACVEIKDRDKRNIFAKELIELMGQLNPHLRNVEDFRHKLWDHLFIMSDFKLDVDSPYPIKDRAEIEKRPARLHYPQSRIKYKHYGKNVETLVSKAIRTEDPEKQAGFTQCIGNFMKLVYQNWSKENVNDETIKNDLRMLSKGALVISDEQDINSLSRANRQKIGPDKRDNNGPRKNNNNNNKFRQGQGGQGQGQGGGNNNNNKNRNKHFKKRPPMG
jgi:hypothetical protein